ncbi:type IV toxin-antitoxin system AbiEi family antitoxin domain-containing protein [Quadrisphaera granulorum]|uniref:type IV toxin-antitoxin system AbiEi family antitoxin domain-containing protein n=1 Tax=Quadrisphaera granulorum TaxID=317664 RepID=UPI0014763C64|nr:type IV toxin-antitoxin system AbiEi family antitoxin domain-containing protein [Quadrisphaera granulorum]
MEITDVCREIWRRGGTALSGELDIDRRSMRRALDSGRVLRLSRGVYALSSQHPPLLAAARVRGVASHTSAAQLWLMDLVKPPALPHVTVRRNRRLQERGLVPHWCDLPNSDINGLVTTPLRTVVDCARTLPFPEGLAVADSALRRGLVTQEELLARADTTFGAGRTAVRRVAQHASPDAANPFESALRGIAIQAGVQGLRPQVLLELRSGLVRPDLVDRRLKLVSEADSFEWHGKRAALASDCRRYNDLVADGWTVLRFAWEQVMFDQEWVAGVLQDTQALLTGSAPPPVVPSSMQKCA